MRTLDRTAPRAALVLLLSRRGSAARSRQCRRRHCNTFTSFPPVVHHPTATSLLLLQPADAVNNNDYNRERKKKNTTTPILILLLLSLSLSLAIFPSRSLFHSRRTCFLVFYFPDVVVMDDDDKIQYFYNDNNIIDV